MKRGLFIVIYGPAGVGKSKQLEILDDTLHRIGLASRVIKYPIYEEKPSGAELERLVHGGGRLLPEENMQEIFAANRKSYEPTVSNWLDAGVTVLAEDYKGTGVAWGMVRGLTLSQMERINNDQLEPDLAILMDGPKRIERAVMGHPYGSEEEWYKIRKVYLQLADRYGWIRIGADAPVLTVAGRIFAVVRPVLMGRF